MSEPAYWQIAVGSYGRDYGETCLQFGVALVGGEANIKRLSQIQPDDRILLKSGKTAIAAGVAIKRDGICVGEAEADEKIWLHDFDGWDLRGYCFVDWHTPDAPVSHRSIGRRTLEKINVRELRELTDQIIAEGNPCQLKPEPEPTVKVSDEEILTFLIKQGLRVDAADELTDALRRIRLLAEYYYDNVDWAQVREHETRTFLVVPLLIALGWTEQQIKIEQPIPGRGRADIACFAKPFRGKDDRCLLLVETKGFTMGLNYAPKQVANYAKELPSCQTVLVSNGYCYKAYQRDGADVFPTRPCAYLNLLDPRARYSVNPTEVDGALEVLRLLLPVTYT